MSKVYLIAILALATTSCFPLSKSENPQWVNQTIEKFKSEPVGNPPQSIWKYEYKGQTVFYVPPQCCDFFSSLFDANGKLICAPDGGLTGRGDGRCSDFLTARTKETLVWKDERSR